MQTTQKPPPLTTPHPTSPSPRKKKKAPPLQPNLPPPPSPPPPPPPSQFRQTLKCFILTKGFFRGRGSGGGVSIVNWETIVQPEGLWDEGGPGWQRLLRSCWVFQRRWRRARYLFVWVLFTRSAARDWVPRWNSGKFWGLQPKDWEEGGRDGGRAALINPLHLDSIRRPEG